MELIEGLDFDESKIRAKLKLILADLEVLGNEFDEVLKAKDKALAAGENTDKLDKQLQGLRTSINSLNKDVVDQTSKLNKSAQAAAKATEEQKGLGDIIKNNIREFKIFGTSLGSIEDGLKSKAAALKSVRAGLGGSITSLKAFRLALIGTGIGVLVVALGSLIAFLTRSQKGMDAVSRVMAQVGAVVGVVADQFVKLGEVIFDTFDRADINLGSFAKNLGLLFVAPSVAARNFSQQLIQTFGGPQEALKSFGVLLKDQILNRIIGIAEGFGAVGRALIELRRGNVREFTNGLEEAAVAAGKVVTGLSDETVKGGFEAISGYVKETSQDLTNASSRAGELEREFQKIRDQEIALNVARAEANKLLKAQNLIAEDVTKSEAERVVAAQKVLDIESKIVDEELSLQARKLAAIKEQKSLTLSTAEDNRQVAEEAIKLADIETRSLEVRATGNNKLNAIISEGIARRKAAAEAERKRIEALTKEYNALTKSLADALQSAQLDDLTGLDRIDAEEEIAKRQVDILEETLRAKAKALNQEFELEAEFAELRKRNAEDFEDERQQLQRDELADSINQREQQLLAEVELIRVSKNEELTLEQFKEQEKLRIIITAMKNRAALLESELGADNIQVQTLLTKIQNLSAEYENLDDERLTNIDERKEQQLALVEAITKSQDKELTLEEFKEKKKTEILIKAAKERAKIIRAQFGVESIEFAIVTAQIEKLENDLSEFGEDLGFFGRIKEQIKEALNLSDEDLSNIASNLGIAFNSIVGAWDALSDAQIATQDRVIDALDERIGETEAALDKELELREDGVRNDASLLEAQLAEEEAQRAAALERKTELERKAANRELIIDSALVGSKLTLAAAETFSAHASTPFVGIAFAIAAIATIASQIAKFKAQAEELSAIPQLRQGSAGITDGVLVSDYGDATHEAGGILGRYKDRQGRVRAVELEENEAVTPVRQSLEHKHFLYDLRKGKYDGVDLTKTFREKIDKFRTIEIKDPTAEARHGILNHSASIAQDFAKRNTPEQLKVSQSAQNALDLSPMLNKLDKLEDVVGELKNVVDAIKKGPEEQITPHPDGTYTKVTNKPRQLTIAKHQ